MVIACGPVTLPLASKLVPSLLALALCGGAWAPSSAFAQSAAPAGKDAAAPKPEPPPEELPAYHHSIFSWDHTVTAATLGVGDTPQSYNPTYTMGFVARTRYYLLDDVQRGRHFSLRLDGGLYREFTNSDVTTQRGELTLSDVELGSVYAHRIQ